MGIHSDLPGARGNQQFTTHAATGFPSPADDFIEPHLDLNERYVLHREATFFIRAQGHGMASAGIHDGDILIVDRSLEATDGRIVFAAFNGDLMVRRFRCIHGQVSLELDDRKDRTIYVRDGQEFFVWGVITTCIHSV